MACVQEAQDSQYACNHLSFTLSQSADNWLEKARVRRRSQISGNTPGNFSSSDRRVSSMRESQYGIEYHSIAK